MAKIIKLQDINQEILADKKSVLAGGCFDILHVGHIKFLQAARDLGEYLIVLLESDENVTRLKGANRPLFKQEERALVLAALNSTDLIVLLPTMTLDQDYQNITTNILPKIIALTEYDPAEGKKRAHAALINAKVEIIPYVKTFSSSKLAHILGVD